MSTAILQAFIYHHTISGQKNMFSTSELKKNKINLVIYEGWVLEYLNRICVSISKSRSRWPIEWKMLKLTKFLQQIEHKGLLWLTAHLYVSFTATLKQEKESKEEDMGKRKISSSSSKCNGMTMLNPQPRNTHLLHSDGLRIQGDFSRNLMSSQHAMYTVSAWSLLSCSCDGLELGSAGTEATGWLFIGLLWSTKSGVIPMLSFLHLGQNHKCMQFQSLSKSVILCSTPKTVSQCCQRLKY